MPALRVTIRETYERLFRDPPEASEQTRAQEVAVESSDEDDPVEQPPAKKLSYGQQLSKLFDEALNASNAVPRQVKVAQSLFYNRTVS
jgi:hypothetical protein